MSAEVVIAICAGVGAIALILACYKYQEFQLNSKTKEDYDKEWLEHLYRLPAARKDRENE